MAQIYRIYLDTRENPHWNLTLDVVVDEERKAKKGVPFCGWWGKIGSTEILPLIVLADGRVDFGSDEETDQAERYGHIDLREHPIELCQKIKLNAWAEETLFQITRVTDLTEL